MNLNRVQLVEFDQDEMIYPRYSTLFEDINYKRHMVPITKTNFYKNDLVGLKTLFEDKKVSLLCEKKSTHLEIGISDVLNSYIPFLFDKKWVSQ